MAASAKSMQDLPQLPKDQICSTRRNICNHSATSCQGGAHEHVQSRHGYHYDCHACHWSRQESNQYISVTSGQSRIATCAWTWGFSQEYSSRQCQAQIWIVKLCCCLGSINGQCLQLDNATSAKILETRKLTMYMQGKCVGLSNKDERTRATIDQQGQKSQRIWREDYLLKSCPLFSNLCFSNYDCASTN